MRLNYLVTGQLTPALAPSRSLPLLLFVFLFWLVRVLDRETPNVQIITDSPDDIHDETSMYTYCQSQAHEDKSDLVDIGAQGTWPSYANMLLKPWTKGVHDAVNERVDENITPREAGFCEMRDDHATNRVRIDEASVEDERHQVVIEDNRLQVEVRRDQNPSCAKGEETK
jgi:hypothetical protein